MNTLVLPDADAMRAIIQQAKHGHRSGEDVLWRVAHYFHMPLSEMLEGGNEPMFVLPRYVAMYLLRESGWSLSRIGRLIRKDHTTVLHGVRKVSAGRLVSPELDAIVKELL